MTDGNAPADGGQGNPAGGTPNPAPAGGTPTPAPAATFYDGIGDADLKGWVQGKNWSDISAMATSHRNLEKMIGAPAEEIVRLGRAPDAETIRNLQTRLGLPDDASEYEIVTTEGLPVDQGFMDAMRSAFHKQGFTADQVKGFTKDYADYMSAVVTQQGKDYAANAAAEDAQLRQEFGNGYDTQLNRASTTANLLGFTPEVIDAMESAMGYGNVIKFFAGLSSKFSEDNFRGGEGSTSGFGFTMTPAEARSEWNRLSADPAFSKALMDRTHPQHKDAVTKKSQLMELMSA